jgi:ubiquinone/menaquinone biosynthesis C-methylase UbiE
MSQRTSTHDAEIADQFTRQAELFASSPVLHSEAALGLLVDAANPEPGDMSLDVACGPGSVVAAFARRVRHAVGLDATEKMLDQARKLVASAGLANTNFQQGDVYALPFADSSFDIVSCRFAVHHLEDPPRAIAEMVRVCKPGGRIVVCDGLASDDPAKAAALNRMEKLRDPSTVEFRTQGYLTTAVRRRRTAGTRHVRHYQVPSEMNSLIAMSFPAGDDRDGLRRMIMDSVDGDKLGMSAIRYEDTVRFAYPSVILSAQKPNR